MTILKLYKCIKSNYEKRFAVGEIYPLYNNGGKNYIVDNNNVNWYENEFPFIEEEYGVELKKVKHKTLINNQQKTIEELKADLTYWKETTDYWRKIAFEFERHNKHLKESSEYYEELCYRLEQHNNHLRKISNKTFDK